jgi:hypothetical protein
MTSLAIADGWMMTSSGPKGRERAAWREVLVAWAAAAMLVGALLWSAPSHHTSGSLSGISSVRPAAGGYAHDNTGDDEDPVGDQACSDRDYANERC